MSDVRKVLLEGGDYNGVEYDLRSQEFDVFAETFVMKVNREEYRTTGEYRDDREIMVYDG